MNNRKARLLLQVPASEDGHSQYFNVTNRLQLEIYCYNRYRSIAYFKWRKPSRAAKRRERAFVRERDEAAAKWRALGLNVRNEDYRPDMFGGRDGTSIRRSHR